MHSEQRWKQRFEHYQAALEELKTSINQKSFTNLERAGIIQYFEVSFELAWKTLQDKLVYEGYSVNSPRSVLKKAFEIGLIVEGEKWLDMIESRNLFAHTYSGKLAEQALITIRGYTKLLIDLETQLENL